MKILYVAKFFPMSSGVIRKIQGQMKAMAELGHQVQLVWFDEAGRSDLDAPAKELLDSTFCRVNRIPVTNRKKFLLSPWGITGNPVLQKAIQECDLIYSRSLGPIYPAVLAFYMTVRKPLVVEHNTMELNEYKLVGSWIATLLERLFGGVTRRRYAGLVGIADEVCEYQRALASKDIPSQTISNGYDVCSAQVRTPNKTENEIHLLAIAKFSRWHGYDRAIHGLAAYQGTEQFKLHLVGDGTALDGYRTLANDLGVVDQIVFHGMKNGQEQVSFFNRCDIGLDAVGCHRKGATSTSSLKSREYMARGIPFVHEDLFDDIPEGYPYILRIPVDESPVDFNQVAEFYYSITDKEKCAQEMHDHALQHIDWSVKMKQLVGFFEEICPSK